MKIGGSIFGLNFSARGMAIQRKKMDVIAQNIANSDNVRTESGDPYKRKTVRVEQERKNFANELEIEGQNIKLNTSSPNHMVKLSMPQSLRISADQGKVEMTEVTDDRPGDIVHMPEHPNANKDGYVEMSNVNVINEMVDMIAATRSYEANLQALNSAKQMAKDSLEM
ncbi:MAG: flagellar basal body rod protein FlgC [Ignavibacteria bacterium]|nr:MAG: flagellar basal body rod protein FlgC [Ignavibacteria bacterium]KAF0160114.1 MAG: flagellar basal body rod protein FlgC [Ignavibacteria bacterium]